MDYEMDKEFNDEQQDFYLQENLKGQVPENQLNNIIVKIRSYLKFCISSHLLDIPIQLHMLVEIFISDSNKYLNILNDQTPVTELYQHFFDEKFKRAYNFDNTLSSAYRNLKNYLEKYFQKVALLTLFDSTFLQNLLNVNEIELENGVENCGIIIDSTDNKKPQFVHNSYANYFAALYFFKNLEKAEKLKDILFEDRYTNLRFLFDVFLSGTSRGHLAVLNKNLEALKDCEVINDKDRGGRNLLHLASSWGLRCPVLSIVKTKNQVIIENNYDQFHINNSNKSKEILEYLINKKIDAGEKDNLFNMDSISYAKRSECLLSMAILEHYQRKKPLSSQDDDMVYSTLYYAVRLGYDSIIDMISNPKFLELETGYSLLHIAVIDNRYNCLRKLISNKEFKENINSNVGRMEFTPLHVASEKGHLEIVKLLIEHGANVDAKDSNGSTPLIVAAFNGHLEVVDYLFKNGTGVNAENKDEFTPLYAAAQNGHLEVVDYLLKNGIDVEAGNNNGATPLYIAAEKGHLEVIDYLFKNGADVNAEDKYGFTPLCVAAMNGHLEVVDYLFKNGANVDSKNNNGATPLYTAAENGHLEVVDYLFKNKADVYAKDNDGFTSLYIAAQNGHLEVVDYLFKNGVDVDVENNNGATPLYTAAEIGHLEVVDYLFKNGADVNTKDKDGFTPLYVAASNGHLDVVDYLFKNKADVNAKDKDGFTPLCVAAMSGHLEVVDYLFKSGANVDTESNNGATPLYIAALNGHFEVVNYLINNGADVNARYENRLTSLQIAEQYGYKDIITLLTNHITGKI